MRAQPKASHFIDGDYVEDTDGTPFESVYSLTGETIARLHEATPAIIERAMAAAARAQKEWATWAPVARARVLHKAAEIIRERNQALSELETLDTAKPLQETLVADATSGADAIEWFSSIAATMGGSSVPLGGDFVYTVREPLGVCVGIGAWNYPMQIACWKSAPALACGNAMVFKPSEMTPLTALKLAEIYMEAGAPKGLFNVVQGMGRTGAALTTHAATAKVSLTGSVQTGANVFKAAAGGMRHVTMELGGKSPILVFDDADLENAISGAILGNFYSAGQICSNGTRVFVQEGIKDRFLERLAERAATIRMGDPMDPAIHMGPLISKAQHEKVMGYIETGRSEGARLVCGGHVPTIEGFADAPFVAATVFADVTDDMTIAREEIFGPVMSVLTFETEAEAVARANGTPFGLAAGVFTSDVTRAHRVAGALDAGITWINTYNLTPVEAPFGGVKESGFGRENGHAAIEFYSQLKTIHVGLTPVESPY
ncbi:betaine-aldehyde dehydrogenase [Fulvimarina sp. 2208YS6-2-32]|uniref:Betaine-aldehyde dehydrogenase n=1 Tax=Fulvimarina uroteuthidis TaxID=3098149 RepID=A0ABU5HYS1_9HYPH|nr:betaine-aldehyde dehydrogenase [Fulvimarina sp. 2208YS6-2-32]MDY8107708.1 betaine-aldehyde dehydrogenase [Fulvimarina sp. 2208YS6-2-32]